LIMEIKTIRKKRLSQISKWVYLTYLTNFAAALSTIFCLNLILLAWWRGGFKSPVISTLH
ncbi:MAG: hypothetical protein ACKOE5_05980, partial [Cytophagales bacterium]